MTGAAGPRHEPPPFDRWLDMWDLVPDGAPFATHSSRLIPVRRGGVAAMLKVTAEKDERWGPLLMRYWDGDGAARVLASDDHALLTERTTGSRSLAAMARGGEDDEATRILCAVAARLHKPRGPLPQGLVPLEEWFGELWPVAEKHGGILARSAATARRLLDEPEEVVTLHGDLHHDNVLDFGERGWLAIDPKRLVGERGFDFASILCNPDEAVATAPGRLERRVSVIAEAAGLDRRRLLDLIVAWAGLSAGWWLGDGVEPSLDYAVAEIAAAERDRIRPIGL